MGCFSSKPGLHLAAAAPEPQVDLSTVQVYGPKKVQTRYMKQPEPSMKPPYSGDPVEYLVDCLDHCFDFISIYEKASFRFTSDFISVGSRAIYFTGDFVLLCGGKTSSKGTWGINVKSGEVTSLAAMVEHREFHSLAVLNNEVYATGGSHELADVSSCEKYADEAWTSLPPMNSQRSRHSSISFNSSIYVFGGLTERSVECFCTSEWSLLRLLLPGAINRPGLSPFSSTSVLLCGGEILGSDYNLKSYEIDLVSCSLTELTPLPEILLCTSPGTFHNSKGLVYSDGSLYGYNASTRQWMKFA